MLTVNNYSSNTFKGTWGDVHFANNRLEINYYPYSDDAPDILEKEVDAKMKELKLNDKFAGQEITPIIKKPLDMTKEIFEKLNRGFLTDTLAKIATKK